MEVISARRLVSFSPSPSDWTQKLRHELLGKSGLKISAMTLGTMNFGGKGAFGDCGADEADRIVRSFLDTGGNLIDTADVYNDGQSESVLGQILKGAIRDKAIVATKAGLPISAGPNDEGLSRHHLTRALDASLSRLNTDHVDVYQCHRWDSTSPIEETMATLDGFVRAGKVRYLGCSNFTAAQIVEAQWAAHREGLTPFVSLQSQYSLVARSIEAEILPTCQRHGLGVLAWSPLAGGLLAADAPLDAGADTRINRMRLSADAWEQQWATYITNPRNRAVATAVATCAAELRVAPAAVATAWLWGRPGITSVVVGPRTLGQLDSYRAGLETELSAEIKVILDDVSAFTMVRPVTGRQRV